jgi:hydroxycarboxylate dehydrogenase B
MTTRDPERLLAFAEGVCLAMGAPSEVAGEVARHLVGANLRGHDSHGVLRLIQYVAELDDGRLAPGAVPVLVRDQGVTGLVDAGRGFGHFSTMFALRWCLERARREGLAAAAVRRSMHIGRLGEYTERAAAEGLIGIVTVGAVGPETGLVAPFGGAARFLGTNPWSIGVPADPRPFIYDAATSAIAEGKARVALAAGKTVPEGAVRDAGGRPTTDPNRLYDGGTLQAMGGLVAGHKGTGLALASALVGGLAMIDDLEPSPAGTMAQPDAWGLRLAGVFIVVIDPARFGDPARYRDQVSKVLSAGREVAPAPGFSEVLIAGDSEARSLEQRSREGIAIPPTTWNELTAIGERFGVPVP